MDKDTFGNRLKQFIFLYYESQKNFADVLGVSKTLINRYCLDNGYPGGEVLIKLTFTGLNLNWLFSGIGMREMDSNAAIAIREKFSKDVRYIDTIKKIRKYREYEDEKLPSIENSNLIGDEDRTATLLSLLSDEDRTKFRQTILSSFDKFDKQQALEKNITNKP